jgi:hypothetical protein
VASGNRKPEGLIADAPLGPYPLFEYCTVSKPKLTLAMLNAQTSATTNILLIVSLLGDRKILFRFQIYTPVVTLEEWKRDPRCSRADYRGGYWRCIEQTFPTLTRKANATVEGPLSSPLYRPPKADTYPMAGLGFAA